MKQSYRIPAPLLPVGLTVLMAGCATPMQVKYDVWNTPRISNSKYVNTTLMVKDLIDARQHTPLERPRGLNFTGGERFVKDGKIVFANNYYHQDAEISAQVTEMLIKHLNAAHLFKQVLPASLTLTTPSEYRLEGTLVRLEAFRDAGPSGFVNSVQSASNQLGLLGGLMNLFLTSGVTAEYIASTRFEHMRFIALPNQQVLWEGSIEGNVNGRGRADANGDEVYKDASESVKRAVEELIKKLQEL